MRRRWLAISGTTAAILAFLVAAVIGAGVIYAATSGDSGPDPGAVSGDGNGDRLDYAAERNGPGNGGQADGAAGGDGSGNDGATPGANADRNANASQAGSGRGGVRLLRVGRFDQPVYVTGAPGFGRLRFVVEQPGRIRVMRGNQVLPRPFLDLTGRVRSGGEQGLLSVAFPPQYRQSGLFYVYYTDQTGDIRIDEFRRQSPVRAAAGSRRPVLTVRHRENSNHNGGQLQFLGNHLYIGTGDGGGGGDPDGNAQNRNSLLGKLLRIDPRRSGGRPYSIPRDNPFRGSNGRDEIYSTGLRNPWRFSFDRVSAPRPRIVIADVGQSAQEEVNYLTVGRANGANFGWNLREGFEPYEGGSAGGGLTNPVFAYGRSEGCSITGGYVVGDRSLRTLYRRYVFADFCDGRLRSFVPRQGRVRNAPFLGPRVASVSSFGQDNQGRIYVTSLSGDVYRLAPR